VSTPVPLPPRPSSDASPNPVEEGLDLGELLDLLAVPAVVEPVAPPMSVSERGAALLAQVRNWSQRAAAWGAGPKGAWRAW
jgi:hypothetical protein